MRSLIFLKEKGDVIAILTLLIFFQYPSETVTSLAIALPLALIIFFIRWHKKKATEKIPLQTRCQCGGYLHKKNGSSHILICNENRGHPEIKIMS